MIVVLRYLRGNAVLTAAQSSLVLSIPGRQKERGGVHKLVCWSVVEVEKSKLMNEFSLPCSSKPGNVGALT